MLRVPMLRGHARRERLHRSPKRGLFTRPPLFNQLQQRSFVADRALQGRRWLGSVSPVAGFF